MPSNFRLFAEQEENYPKLKAEKEFPKWDSQACYGRQEQVNQDLMQ